MALGEEGPGNTGTGTGTGTTEEGPGAGGFSDFGGSDSDLTDQAPGGFGDTAPNADTNLTDLAPGETLAQAQARDFATFGEDINSFVEQLQFALGFGPEVTGAVKTGAAAADPAAFSRGVKTGIGFELAQSFAGLGGLPAAAATSILDRVVTAVNNPAFAAGRASVSNPFGQLAPAAGLAAGLATGSIGLARAVELGLNVAGVATQVPEQDQRGQPTPERVSDRSDATQVASAPVRQNTQLGAAVTSSTDKDFERSRRKLSTREALGRAALTIRRA